MLFGGKVVGVGVGGGVGLLAHSTNLIGITNLQIFLLSCKKDEKYRDSHLQITRSLNCNSVTEGNSATFRLRL